MSIQSQKDMLSRYAKDNGFLNCEFYVDDGFSDTNFRRPSFQKMIEDKDISKKIKSARMARARAGKFVSSIPPIGYMLDPNDKTHLIIDDKTAPIIRMIYSYALEELGSQAICSRLRENKIPRSAYYRGRSYHNKSSDQDKYFGHIIM